LTQTVNTIDYGIKAVTENGDQTKVSFGKDTGRMPIDLLETTGLAIKLYFSPKQRNDKKLA
jgi:hypothetical protein